MRGRRPPRCRLLHCWPRARSSPAHMRRVHFRAPRFAPNQMPARLVWAYQHSEGQDAVPAHVFALHVLIQLRRHPVHEDRQQLQSSVAAPLDRQTVRGPSLRARSKQAGEQVSRAKQARLRPGQRSQRAAASAGLLQAGKPLY